MTSVPYRIPETPQSAAGNRGLERPPGAAGVTLHQAMDEPRQLLVVDTPVEGEYVCEELRAAEIRCACVELPGEGTGASPVAYLGSLSGTPAAWTVLVAESDLERAREVLGDRLERQPPDGGGSSEVGAG